MAQNLARYLGCCGATAAVLPEDVADRAARRSLCGQADEDSTGADQLEIIRRVFLRQGFALWLELDFEGPGALPGLPPPDSAEAARARPGPPGQFGTARWCRLSPAARRSSRRHEAAGDERVALLKADGTGSTGGGLVIRLGPGATLLGTPDTGLDDTTYRKFTHDTFGPEAKRGIPGVETTDPDRFAVRSKYVAGVGRMPWLMWRSKEITALYRELNAAVHAAAPRATLAVVTPCLDGGPAGSEARRVDRAALPPSQSWRSVGLDLQTWPSGPGSPLVLRGTALSTEALSHDLATSSDLDALVAARPHRGLLLSVGGAGAAEDVDDSPAGADAEESLPKKAGVEAAAAADGNGPARLAVEGVSRAAALRARLRESG